MPCHINTAARHSKGRHGAPGALVSALESHSVPIFPISTTPARQNAEMKRPLRAFQSLEGGKRLDQVAELTDHYEHAARIPQPIRFAFLRLG